MILLVEDNLDDVLITVRAFKQSQLAHEVVVASDGQEALDYLMGTGVHAGRNTDELPAVVLVDLQLPRISGFDVIRRIRADERTCRQPVVILTSSNEEQDLIAGYDVGANSYVRKPVDFAQFLETTKTLGVYWLNVNQVAPTTG